MIWTKGEETLKEFLTYINSAHNTIKFTWEWSTEKVNYLDVLVKNIGGKIETDLYVKPTDKHQYLYYKSCHPRKCKEGIPYAQALRLRRICSKDEYFERRAQDLTTYLTARGYRRTFVVKEINKARIKTRHELLKENQREVNRRVPFVTTYHPGLPNIGKILRDLHPVLHSSDRCKEAVKEIPVMAFRRPKCLKDYLVHAKLKPKEDRERKGCHKCEDRRCRICKLHMETGTEFRSKTTGQSYSINYNLNCNSSNVIYLLSCKKCGLQYVGSTKTKFRLRFNNHKSRLRSHNMLSINEKDNDDIIYKHFWSPGHSGIDDVNVQIIDKVSNEKELRDKEGQWAYKINSISPNGLNDNDFFYNINRRRGRNR